MKPLELILVLVVIALYLWWRVKRRIAVVKASVRSERRQTEDAQPAPGPITLEKDPQTGVYRPPKA